MKRRVHVTWVGLLLAALALTATVTAQVVSAHATRVSSQPADNAVLTAGPDQVRATFNEQLQTSFAAMAVVGPDGNLWSIGQPTVQGAVVGVGVRPLGPAGTYTVNYRVTSADGHVVSGSWSFRLTVPGTGTPGPAPAATDTGGRVRTWVSTWPFLVLTLALVAAAAWWAMRRRP
jgi:copper resistance protein C